MRGTNARLQATDSAGPHPAARPEHPDAEMDSRTIATAAGSSPSAVGWQVVPDEPPGTFAWWNGEQHVAIAFWTGHGWEFVTDDWSGSDPPPGVLPTGAATPAAHGWMHTPDGRWQHVEFISTDPHPEPLPDTWRQIGIGVIAAIAGISVMLILGFVLWLMFWLMVVLWALGQIGS